MMLPAELLQFEITLEDFEGVNGMGESVYGAPVTLACFKEEGVRLVRDRTTGDQRTGSTTIWIDPRTPVPTVNSRITLSNGSQPDIIAVFDRDGGTLAVPSHIEIVCL